MIATTTEIVLGIAGVAVIGWAGWVSVATMSNSRNITKLIQTCSANTHARRLTWVSNAIRVLNDNMIRVGCKVGLKGIQEMEPLPSEPDKDQEN